MFFFEEIGKEETEGGERSIKKTYHNSQRAVACNMFNFKKSNQNSLTTFSIIGYTIYLKT